MGFQQMIRRWAVQPDMGIETSEGVVGVVSRELLNESLLDAGALLDRLGGAVTIVVGRHRTDMDGEAVTTGAAFEWKSGPRAPAQPEANVEAPGVRAEEEPEPEEESTEPLFEEPVPAMAGGVPEAEMEEDLTGIPEEQR